jgi:hypothetical protein
MRGHPIARYLRPAQSAISIVGAIVIFVLMLGGCEVASAAACGGLNQRPCKVFERIPSCNRGLVEDLRHGRCIAKAKRSQRPLRCGALNQRPCRVNERVPSCNRGLVEDLRHGRCIAKAKPKPVLPHVGRPIIRPAPKPHCGALNQRACKVTERVPSCDRGLVEIRGKCLRRLNCGAEGQRPCTVAERIPSCNKGLVEYTNGKCMRPVCGGLGMRACKIGERIPSCDKGLRESLGKCVRLKPGELAVLASIGEYSRTLAETSERKCIDLLSRLSVPSTTVMHVRLDANAAKYFAIGFSCASLEELDQLSGYTELAQEMNRQFHKPPCAKWVAPVRPICTIFRSTYVAGGAFARCMVELAKQKLVTSEHGRSSVRELWLGIGKFAWRARKLDKQAGRLIRNLRKKAKKKKPGAKKSGNEKGSGDAALDAVFSAIGLQIKFTAKTEKVLNGPVCRGVN